MTPLPNLPTDNLYKFLFIAGLSIILATVIIFITQYKTIREEQDKNSLEIANLINEMEFSTEDMKETSENFKQKGIDDSEVKNQIEQVKLKRREIKVRNDIMNLKIQKSQQDFCELIALFIVTCLMVLIGIIMSVRAYFNWLYLVQKPMDEKLKLELEKLKSDLAKEKSV